MSKIAIIFKRELRSYFVSPFGWIILGFILLLQGVSLSAVFKIFKDGPQPESVLFYIVHAPTFWFYYLFSFPLITMRSFADEEKSGTLETMLTAPIKTGQLVVAKFLASFVFFIILWLPLLCFPVVADLAGNLVGINAQSSGGALLAYTNAELIGTYAVILLSGAWFCSIGLLCSALTNSQIVAGIISTAALVLIFFLGMVPMIWGEFFAAGFFHYISLSEHLETHARGIIDTRPVVFYASMCVVTLAMCVRVIDHRRWKQ